MNSNLTELIFVIDASGSMYGLTADTIGGFNATIEQYRHSGHDVLVSTILFNEHETVLHDRVPIADVPVMTEKDYQARGGTALMDALGGAIHHMGNVHKYAREEDRPAKTMVVVTTDGMENSSVRYSAEEVRTMVRHEEEKYGWEFLFLGANIQSVTVAESYGIRPSCTVDYVNDSEGTRVKFRAVANAVGQCLNRKPLENASWRKEADADFAVRGHR